MRRFVNWEKAKRFPAARSFAMVRAVRRARIALAVLAVALPDPGPPALGFARRFRRGETGRVESLLQQQGFPGLRVFPDSGREERTAILWLRPLLRSAIGSDMLADPVRREALERARDTGSRRSRAGRRWRRPGRAFSSARRSTAAARRRPRWKPAARS